MIALRICTIHTLNNADRTARFHRGRQLPTCPKIHVGIGESAVIRTQYVQSYVNLLIILYGSCRGNLEHRIKITLALIGDDHSIYCLLFSRCGRVIHRCRNGVLFLLGRGIFLLLLPILVLLVLLFRLVLLFEDVVGRRGGGELGGDDQVHGGIGVLRDQVILQQADGDTVVGFLQLAGGQGEVVDPAWVLRVLVILHAQDGSDRLTGIHKSGKAVRIVQIQVGIGIGLILLGCDPEGDVNGAVHRKGCGGGDTELGTGRALVLLGHQQAGGLLLLRVLRGGGIGTGSDHRSGNRGGGKERDHRLLRHGGDNQLPLLYPVAQLLAVIRGNQAEGQPGIVGRAGGEVEQQLAVVAHGIHHGEGAALGQPGLQLRLGAEVQVAVSGRHAHVHGGIQRAAIADRRYGIDGEIPAAVIGAGVHDIHAVDQALFHRGGIIERGVRVGQLPLRLGLFGLGDLGFGLFRLRFLRLGDLGLRGLRSLGLLRLRDLRLGILRLRGHRRRLRGGLGRGFRGSLPRRLGLGLRRGFRLGFRLRHGLGLRLGVRCGGRLHLGSDLHARLNFLCRRGQRIARQHGDRQQERYDSRP